MRPAALIYNPEAGRRQASARRDAIVTALAGAGFAAEPLPTAAPGDATRLAAQAVRAGAEAVFALGGDGTLRETAAGLLGSPVALGPLPAGTGNIVARALGVPLDPLRAASAVGQATVRPLRVGLCAERPFLLQASAGLDSQTMANLGGGMKRSLGQMGYTLAMVREWWRYDYPEIRLSANGDTYRVGFAAACNLPRYGPFHLVPSRGEDDRLPLVLFTGRNRSRTLAFTFALARGRHLERSDVRLERVEALEIQGPAELVIQLDGCATDLRPPVTIRRAPHRLNVLCP